MNKAKKIVIWLAVGLAIVLAIVSLLLTVDLFVQPNNSQIEDILSFYISQNQNLAALIFVGVAALSSMMPPMATITFLPPVLVVWPKILVLSLTLLGWLIGGALLYFLTRYLARPVLEQFFSFRKIDFFVASLPKKLAFWFVVLFRIAIPAEIPTITLGLVKYPFFAFLLVAALGELPSAISYIYLADEFLAKRFGNAILIFAFSAILLIAVIYLFVKKFKHLTGAVIGKEVLGIDFDFMKIAVANYKSVGAIFPTSRAAAKRVAKIATAKYMVEYGGGSGAVTRALLSVLPEEGRLLCVELNPAFCQELQKIEDKRLVVINENALNLPNFVKKYLPEVETIVTSLPFSYMDNAVVDKIIKNSFEILKPGGKLILHQDNPFLARFLKSYFKKVRVRLELLNFPPRFVIIGKK